jgi:hypothetical protein
MFIWAIILGTTLAVQPEANVSAVAPAHAISTTIALYTDFDLFKNTGFEPCIINSNTTADATTNDFIVTREISTQAEFCSFMAGTPIMIPTQPNKVAFFPWYPTMIIQTLSLLVSYVGLFFILQRVDKCRNSGQEYKHPFWYWPLMAMELARNIAFAYEVAHGFSDPSKFSWVAVLYWVLPLNFVLVCTQMRAVRQSARLFAAAAATFEDPYPSTAAQIRHHFQMRASQLLGRRSQSQIRRESDNLARASARPASEIDAITALPGTISSKPENPRYTASSGFPSLPSVAGDYAKSNRRRNAPRGATVWSWIITASINWFITLITTVLHWRWSFPHPSPIHAGANAETNSTAPMAPMAPAMGATTSIPSAALGSSLYSQIPLSISNPQSVGNMPVSCLSYLSAGSLLLDENGAFFAEPIQDLSTFSVVETLQFCLATLAVVIACYILFIRRGSRPTYPQFVSTSPYAAAAFAHDEQMAQASSSKRTRTLLFLSAGMTAFFLLLPALALGIEMATKARSGRVSLRFTNNLEATGGCTFAFVTMDSHAGYWDVAVDLGERVVMALLGVA